MPSAFGHDMELEFPRFDGHFFIDEGECFSCRERETRTRDHALAGEEDAQ